MTPVRSICVAAMALLATASCGTWGDEAENPVDVTTLDVARPGLAVAPIIGAPVDASARLTEIISSAASARGVPLAMDNMAAGFDYVLEGTASARQTPQGTVLAFAWDLTDANGIRQHRFIDTQIVPTRSPQVAWSTAGNASLSKVAMQVADELAGFYGQQAVLANAGTYVGDTSMITTAALPPTGAPSAPAPAPVDLTGPITLHLREVAGEPKSAQPILGPALRRAFQSKGANLLAAPEPGILLVTGSMVVRPSSAGGDMVTLQWDVTRAGGAPVGSIVQERLFAPGQINTAWTQAAPAAAEEAVRAVYALVSPDRDTKAKTAALRELRGFTSPDAY
ncbi:hypothetical protein NBRC116588_04750 [Pyruvatibacter sp. HU-CL02332]|uniref:hypothetical protein n=1 Tax=Pyruvatibacter sp. HU-CL02332 TaxID=3127650 RepID=UPI00310C6E7B